MSRPVAHFAPRTGWLNDPYGVRWDGRRYHLYFQALPHRTQWAPECSWGRAVSSDLVTWQERPIALRPQAGEVGCWSGSVAEDGTGRPLAFYTSVREPDPERGSIAIAYLDESGQAPRTPRRTVIEGPPQALDVVAFRDPFVLDSDGGKEMIVGGGLADGSGCVFAYRAANLLDWRYAGPLHAGRADIAAGRQVWECPQLLAVDGRQLLIVSVQVDGAAAAVLAATRDPAGGFGPWQRLVHGPSGYATSAFYDREGRPCVISWLREDPDLVPGTRGWAGVQSLVGRLRISPDGPAVLEPHPAVLASGAFRSVHDADALKDAAGAVVFRQDGPADLTLDRGRHGLSMRTVGPALEVRRGPELAAVVPGLTGSDRLTVFLDGDTVELFWGGSYAAFRLPD